LRTAPSFRSPGDREFIPSRIGSRFELGWALLTCQLPLLIMNPPNL
jgi:hypothetical protein